MRTLNDGLCDQLARAVEGDGVGVDRLTFEPHNGTVRLRMTLSGVSDVPGPLNQILDGDVLLRHRIGRVFPGYADLHELFRNETGRDGQRTRRGAKWTRVVEFSVPTQEIVYLISVGYPHRSYASSGAGPCAHLRESRADESDTPDTSIEIPTPQPCAA